MALEVNQTALKIIGKYFNVFVNEVGEIVIIPELNIFINVNFTNDDDLKVKTINLLSRSVNDYVLTRGQRELFLRMSNEILGKQFSRDDWYTKRDDLENQMLEVDNEISELDATINKIKNGD